MCARGVIHSLGDSQDIRFRITMANIPLVTSSSGLRKFQADGFLFDREYNTTYIVFHVTYCSLQCLCSVTWRYIKHYLILMGTSVSPRFSWQMVVAIS